ncbi:MAG: four helix bundle protein [Clostridia bacterium]|nr:four helix bundle protein [Clostridia bacterium]
MGYQDLLVWQKAMDLVEEIYRVVKLLPREELYALSSQMRRAAVSIPSNIAEGQSRITKKDFAGFLAIARGSNAELRTQCLICIRLGYIPEQEMKRSLALSDEIGKMLSSMLGKMNAP